MYERAGRFFKADETGKLVSEFSKRGKELEKLEFSVAAYAVFWRQNRFGEWQEKSDTRIEVPPVTYNVKTINM